MSKPRHISLIVTPSFQREGLLSLRLRERPGLGPTALKKELIEAGYRSGDRVTLVSTEELHELERAWAKAQSVQWVK